MSASDYEREQQDEIDHDAGGVVVHHAKKRRKDGGTTQGHTARHRLDRAHRQVGGVNQRVAVPVRAAAAPATTARPTAATVNPALARAVAARRLQAARAGIPAAAAPAAPRATGAPVGAVKNGGRTNGEKWVPGLGVEKEDRHDKSQGDATLEGNMKSGGRLTAHERQSLPKSDFALPGKGEGPKGAGSGSYPIPDESHARNALARVSQHGSSSEKSRVRAAVHRKFPDIEQSAD
jgi:hypothetical protein